MTYSNLKPLAQGAHPFISEWRRSCDEAQMLHDRWIQVLRDNHVKAAHPDDGWVDRKANVVDFVYPHFNDGCQPGDLVALGYHVSYRMVRLVERLSARSFLPPQLNDERWRFVVSGEVAE